MKHDILPIALLSLAFAFGASGIARADCESDLLQLEQAFKTPGLTAAANTALEAAKTKSVAALKKDDDTTCHKAIAEGMKKAGLTLKQ